MDWSLDRLTKRLTFSAELTEELFMSLAEIDAIKKSWSLTGKIQPQTLERLTHSVIVTSTGASNRIEGNRLSDAEVEKLYRNFRIQKFKTRDEQEVAGYLEMLQFIFANHEGMGISESNILLLHERMLQHSEKDSRQRGKYKFGSNRVEAKDQSGNVLGVIFDPTPPHLVAKEMQELVEWYSWAISESKKHSLLILANFIFEYLAIHPFQDGNGRTSRLLTNLMLLHHGYQFATVVSHEKLVETRKADYYLTLNQTQKTWKTDAEDLSPWIRFFLGVIQTQAETALELLQNQDNESLLSEKQLQILQWARGLEQDTFTRREAIQALAMPPRTIEECIKKLMEYKMLERLGLGRGTRYHFPNQNE